MAIPISNAPWISLFKPRRVLQKKFNKLGTKKGVTRDQLVFSLGTPVVLC